MKQLHLMKTEIDLASMTRWSAEQRHSDADRAAHCLLAETFSPGPKVRPFVLKHGKGGSGHILAYTGADAEQLKEAARTSQKVDFEKVMDPSRTRTDETLRHDLGAMLKAKVLDPDRIKTIEIPDDWETGTQVEFEVRIRPTYRYSERDENHPNTERDIYLALAGEETRAERYCQWLERLTRRQGGMKVEPSTMAMTAFSQRKVKRQRVSGWSEGPDATIRGTATVKDEAKFRDMLTQGIGRHKGYGYGMVLVRKTGICSLVEE